MTWHRIIDRSFNFKPHFISAEIAGDIAADLAERGCVIETEPPPWDPRQDFEELHFETGGGYGMRSMAWSSFEFTLGDKVLKLDADVISYTLACLETYDVRTAKTGKRYLKLYSRFACLVITETESLDLIGQIRNVLGEANKIAAEFSQEENKALKTLEDKGVIKRISITPQKTKN